jgi:hypothetical protein
MAAHSQIPKDRYIGFAYLLITSIGWGLNWPVIKVVLRDWPPLFARGSAGLVARHGLSGSRGLARATSFTAEWRARAARRGLDVERVCLDGLLDNRHGVADR